MRPLPKPRRLPLTFWAAVVLVAVAAVSSVLWARWQFFDALAPNVITEALGIAVTITAIEWIVRRQAEERLRPRTDDVLYWMGLDFRMYLGSVTLDYASTHLVAIKQIPRDATKLIQLWHTEHEAEDWRRDILDGEWLPTIVLSAVEFEKGLRRARERDLDVLEPDLVRAIDEFIWHLGQCAQMYGLARSEHCRDPLHSEALGIATLMRRTELFAEVLRRHAEQAWFDVQELTIAAALEVRNDHIQDREGAMMRP